MKNFLLALFFISAFGLCSSAQTDTPYVAGFRASRILSSYPGNTFPNDNYWTYVGNEMAAKFDSTGTAAIWIVSLYQSAGVTRLNFPSPGGTYPNITFGSTDQNEAYLDRFDQEGFKVWLQVEPGEANVDTLIKLVTDRYKHHPCVAGFGVDVEWLNSENYSGGQHVTDSMAQSWEIYLHSIDTSYVLFLKHYSYNWMPPTYRGKILFVDDSQGFTSLNQMKNEFVLWGNHFPANNVAFQFGYKADSTWWKQYADPPLTIGTTLRSNIPNCYGLFWVDFTICQIFDISVRTDDVLYDSEITVVFNSESKCAEITGTEEGFQYRLTDSAGKIISSGIMVRSLFLGEFESGIYFLQIFNHKTSRTFKILNYR